MRRMLIFIAGTKGGVGKSFASAMLAGGGGGLGLLPCGFVSDKGKREPAPPAEVE